jgi:1-acyl-sn-glycerol-3-phosphate acyltransferase
MFRYIRAVTLCFFDIVFGYFTWMIPFSRHPERWPLEYRYAKMRKLVLKIVKHLHVDYYITNGEILSQPGTYLFIGNHYSMYDALITVCLSERPIIFVGKHEILKWPFFGRIMKGIDCVFIKRNNLRQEIEVMKKVKNSLAEKSVSWAIFPEGTRNKDIRGKLLPFKAGTFKMALETKTPIVPMTIYGTFRPLNTKYHMKRFPVQVKFLEPIMPEQYQGMTSVAVSDLVRGRMQVEIDQLRETDTKLVPVKILAKEKRLPS